MAKNISDLFDVNLTESAKHIDYLSGMKALSYLGIIWIHSLLVRMWFPIRDPGEIEIFLNQPMADIVKSYLLNVDTFLLVSGLLITRSILKELDK